MISRFFRVQMNINSIRLVIVGSSDPNYIEFLIFFLAELKLHNEKDFSSFTEDSVGCDSFVKEVG